MGDHEVLQLGEHEPVQYMYTLYITGYISPVLLLLPATLLAGVGAGQGAGQALALVLHPDQVVDHLNILIKHDENSRENAWDLNWQIFIFGPFQIFSPSGTLPPRPRAARPAAAAR